MQHSFKLDPRVARAFLGLAGGFWTGATRRQAWLLTIGLATALTLSMVATVALNRWNRWFFDALEKKDAATAATAVLVFAAIIAAMAAVGVMIVLTRDRLQVRWRAWLVHAILARWLDRQRYYHLEATGTQPANPEYRIADDSRWATEPLVDLAIGMFSAIIGAAAFISILWTVGGSYRLAIGGTVVHIPAYMVLLALAYGVLASVLMHMIGRPLVGRVGAKNAAEGEFRFALMRLRENAESIALMKGEAAERAALSRFYDAVVERWLAVVRSHGHITWVTNSSGPMIPIVPLLFAAPKYFAGELSLGEVTQLAGAFVQVQLAISWLVDNYNRIAEWYASARRVMDVVEASEGVDSRLAGLGAGRVAVVAAPRRGVRLAGLTLADASGKPLVQRADLEVAPGERVLVSGPSSTGKTLLARAIGGLWPWGRGEIQVPAGESVMVVPQKPYIPTGTLAEALRYPDPASAASEAELAGALEAVGLGALAGRLGEAERWDQVLGSGERQRLAIARLIVHRPDVVVLDDALSAVEEEAQDHLRAAIARALPEATIVSFGQRPGADPFHRRHWSLSKGREGSLVAPAAAAPLVPAG